MLSPDTRRTLGDVLPVWSALVIFTTLPYLIAQLRTPPGYRFTGVLTAYDDTLTYLAWMKQGAGGRLLMCDLFTSEQQACEFFLPLWVILGGVARLTGAPVVLVFHAARLASALVLLVAARGVARLVTRSPGRVRYSLWLYAMTAGLGWLVYALNNRGALLEGAVTAGSADLTLPEAIAFRSAYAQVHFTLGAALVAAALLFAFKAMDEKDSSRAPTRRRALIAGALVSLLAVVHPYLVVVVLAVAALAALFSARSIAGGENGWRMLLRAAFWFSVSSVPGIAYLFYLNSTNEVLREWLRITDTLSPPATDYVLGFGIILVFAVAGFRLMLRERKPSGRFLLIWAAAQGALLYAPVNFQRRFVEGLQLPLAVAASAAIFWLAQKVRARYRRPLLAAIMIVASLTNIGFIAGQILARDRAASDPRRYVTADLIAALDWMSANATDGAVLFSSYFTGNLAPSITGRRVYLGHYGQTIASDEKGRQVAAFYSGAMDERAARQLFRDHRISHVIYGPFEREISSSFAAPAWLKLVHRAGDVEIYGVIDEERTVRALRPRWDER